MVPIRSVNSDFVSTPHVAVHGFPLAATAEHGGRGVGDRFDHSKHHRPDLFRTGKQKVPGRHGLLRVVRTMTLKEVDAPRPQSWLVINS
jgi:hypothetical protein